MKIAYETLLIEVTRKCNQSCNHCMRGPAQNLNMEKEIVDSFFYNNDLLSIENLVFTGGEPTLNPKIISYIVDNLIKREIDIKYFNVIVNGLKTSKIFENSLDKLYSYVKETSPSTYKKSGLGISNTQYHKSFDQDVVDSFKKIEYFTGEQGKGPIDDQALIPIGNALYNGLSIRKINYKKIMKKNKTAFELKYVDNEFIMFFPDQHLSANGNLTNDVKLSYDLIDDYHILNVKDESIKNHYSTKKKLVKSMKKIKRRNRVSF